MQTRCKRGPNEVRNQILGDWPPKSPDKEQLDSRAFSGGAEEETKPSSSCRQEQGERRGDKGRVRETEGRQHGIHEKLTINHQLEKTQTC